MFAHPVVNFGLGSKELMCKSPPPLHSLRKHPHHHHCHHRHRHLRRLRRLLPPRPHPATTRLIALDARRVCDGATGRNGGHCKLVPHEELAKLTPRFGQARAAELVRFQRRHIACLAAVCALVDAQLGEPADPPPDVTAAGGDSRDDDEGRETEFRDVETVDIYLEAGLFDEAKEKVETLRAVMPEIDVRVWEPPRLESPD
ncbi:unnamed protein product [Parascedosporium putredinis]|uniref:Uncharacterized protein n=1 Tax=Parascedosporium putredinis TaxID=1442378 RepID=A0A9P1MDJ1_9PEZI|nr:unnamed protein product [Parascedosporium putredinis]CAI7999750.1 unnamed protein product [Parascedosporium putredinis]